MGGPSSPCATTACGLGPPHSPRRRSAAGQVASVEAEVEGAADSLVSGCSGAVLAASPSGASGCVYSGVVPRLGVGSKRVQPTPWKYSSGHACASRRPTDIVPSSPVCVPGVNPIATRAGMPSVRAIAAIEKEKWTQKPSFCCRNRAIACGPLPAPTRVLYVKPPS
ncbi:hypothetical protein GA0115252_11362 [Streptomyces sp. DfronAA-171]|nr:hypothetical protein GA0115252_11362 [Streptomyces sp. DfronAA-171]